MTKKLKPCKNGSNQLTDKQKVFVEEYLKDNELNAAEAARKAGYSAKNAGNKLLNTPAVAKAIGKEMRLRSERNKVDADSVLNEIASIAFLNIQDFIREDGSYKDVHELPRHAAAAVQQVFKAYNKVTNEVVVTGYAFWDKTWAIEVLMKHLGMADSRFQVDVTHNVDNFIASLVERSQQNDAVIDGNVIAQRALE